MIMHAMAAIFDVQYLAELKESNYSIAAAMFQIYLDFQ
jgi:hypothetical protein